MQSYSQVTSVYERGIVLLHSNSFQRNLWSETLLFGLHITAKAEKWADCGYADGFVKPSKQQWLRAARILHFNIQYTFSTLNRLYWMSV